MHITQLNKLGTLCAEADKHGLRLEESGSPRGETRWFHLYRAKELIKESSDLRVIETAIKNAAK